MLLTVSVTTVAPAGVLDVAVLGADVLVTNGLVAGEVVSN